MYKESFVDNLTNEKMKIRVKQELDKFANRIIKDNEPETVDLYNLCVLNRMLESHEKENS